jgi:nucleotide-binding universal stress UspA family protein
MTLTSLMVYVDTHDAESDHIELAGALADRFDAMLIGMSALALRPPVVVDGVPVDGVLMQAEIKNIKAKLAEKGNWFRAIATGGHRRLEWRYALDLPTEALARECRSADMVVIGREAGRGDVYSALDPAGAILKVGRPALVVPPKVKSLSAEHVIVGWKDTREARRAVYDALPLLRKAARVLVVEIFEASEKGAAQEQVSDVVHYLVRHQVRADARVVPLEDGSGAKQLLRSAEDEGADLLVAGAYGHSRLGEWVFGGMTRELLAASPICCLLSH